MKTTYVNARDMLCRMYTAEGAYPWVMEDLAAMADWQVMELIHARFDHHDNVGSVNLACQFIERNVPTSWR